jgi:hypothetical protein
MVLVYAVLPKASLVSLLALTLAAVLQTKQSRGSMEFLIVQILLRLLQLIRCWIVRLLRSANSNGNADLLPKYTQQWTAPMASVFVAMI